MWGSGGIIELSLMEAAIFELNHEGRIGFQSYGEGSE